MAAKLKIKQIRSANGANPAQRATLRSLKLGRIGSETERPKNEALDGMVNTVSHLVEVEEVS